jgi:hypothetical protein
MKCKVCGRIKGSGEDAVDHLRKYGHTPVY